MNLFAYGTLKQGHGNHRIVEDKVRHVAPTCIVAGYTLHAFLNSIPYAAPMLGGIVQGELLVGDFDLAALDRLEGHPSHYRRIKVTVHDLYGEPTDAWMYVCADSIGHKGSEPWDGIPHIGSIWPPRAAHAKGKRTKKDVGSVPIECPSCDGVHTGRACPLEVRRTRDEEG